MDIYNALRKMPARFLQTGAKAYFETLVVKAAFLMKLMALSISLRLAFIKGICLNRQADIRVMDCSMVLKCLSLRSVGVSVSSAIRITASLQNGIRVLTQAWCSLNNSLGSSFWRTSLISIMVIVFGLESEFYFTKIGTGVSTDAAVENTSYYFLSPKLHKMDYFFIIHNKSAHSSLKRNINQKVSLL